MITERYTRTSIGSKQFFDKKVFYFQFGPLKMNVYYYDFTNIYNLI